MRATPISDCEVRDPRIKRTRQLLQEALRKLLQTKRFDEILVQDITEAATVNRATFYDHYTDKFALFDAMVAGDFHKLLQQRNIQFDGTCTSAIAATILAVRDYLEKIHGNRANCARQGSFSSLVDAAVTRAIQIVMLNGLRNGATHDGVSPEILASTVSWAIYGAAREWFFTPQRKRAEEVVPSLAELILPLVKQGSGRPNRPKKGDIERRRLTLKPQSGNPV
jgi:AcrR family transcriptional regulator